MCESEKKLEGKKKGGGRAMERSRTVSEMNRGEKGEKDQVKDAEPERRESTDIMVLLDGCPPSICSVHCFINSIKLQAS